MAKEQRLQKVLAQAGVASRRAAEEWIRAGRVRVNGKIIAELGAKVGDDDKIEVDGKRILAEKYVYYAFHKPRLVVTTMSDPEGRPTVQEYFKTVPARVFPVGRLDFHTSGLILVTNDGDFANALMHPTKSVPKKYVLKVKGAMKEEDIEHWRTGVMLDDGKTLPAEVELLRYEGDKTWIEITIHEGRNQQIRRMGEATGFLVMRLARLSFAGISSDAIAPGKVRPLSLEELRDLQKKFGVPKKLPAASAMETSDKPVKRSSDRRPAFDPRGDQSPRGDRGAPRVDARGSARSDRGAPRGDARGERGAPGRFDARGPGRSDRFESRGPGRSDRGDSRGAPRGDARGERGAPARFDARGPGGSDSRGPGRSDRGDARGPGRSDRGDSRGPGRSDRFESRGPGRSDSRGPNRSDRGDSRGAPRGEPRSSDRNDRGGVPRGGARGASFSRDRNGPPAGARGRSGGRADKEWVPRGQEARGSVESRTTGARYGGGSPGRRSYEVKEDWGGGVRRGRSGDQSAPSREYSASDTRGNERSGRSGAQRGSESAGRSGGRNDRAGDDRQSRSGGETSSASDRTGRSATTRTTGSSGGIGGEEGGEYRISKTRKERAPAKRRK